jgi:hypothetical protein
MIETSRPSALGNAGLIALILFGAWAAPVLNLRGLTLTGDRLVGLAAVLMLALVMLRHGLRWTPLHTALAVFTGVQVLTSVISSSTWPSGAKFASVYVLGFACFALAAEWSAGREALRRATRVWVGLGAALGIVGMAVSIAANVMQVKVLGSGLSQRIHHPDGGRLDVFAAKVIFNEWNLYSSFLLVAFALAVWTWRPAREGRAAFWWGFVPVGAVSLGVVFGLTRAAWVGMAGIALFWLWKRRPAFGQVAALGLVVGAGLLVQTLAIGASPLYFRLIKPIEVGRDQNLAVRVGVSEATLESWREHPVVGSGAGSTNRLRVPFRGVGPDWKPWNGNIVLFVLHDSGLVGLAALAAVLAVVVLMARRALRASADRAVLVPLLAAGVALLWAYQFTHGLWLMYPYIYLGILAAAIQSRAAAG